MRCAALCVLASLAVTASAGKRLIETAPGVQVWMTEEEVAAISGLPGKKNNFIDVTSTPNVTRHVRAEALNYPTVGVHHHYIEAILDNFNFSDVVNTINSLAAYHTRYYTTQTGVDAVMWLAQQYQAAALGRSDVHVEVYFHSAWAQPSIIVTVDGSGTISDETVVLGGHIDSINGGGVNRAPGADDDASGSATVFSIFKALMQNQFKPEKTVEFHAYAAEEVGLRGSADIADHYAREARNVYSMLQLDMTGYTGSMAVPAIGLIQDNTDPTLNSWLIQVIQYYLSIGYTPSNCGYGCSDHASFNRNGYPAAFPFEAPFGSHNPNIHTANDVISVLNQTHMFEFVKLGVAYVCDMACPEGMEGCT